MQNNVLKLARKQCFDTYYQLGKSFFLKISGQRLNDCNSIKTTYFPVILCKKFNINISYRKVIDVKLMEHSFFWEKCTILILGKLKLKLCSEFQK
jgi:hypothetical protein